MLSLGLRATLHTCCGELTGFGLVEMAHTCTHAEEVPVCHSPHSGCCAEKKSQVCENNCDQSKKCCGEEELFILFDQVQTQPKEQNPLTFWALLPARVRPLGVLPVAFFSREKEKPQVNDPPPEPERLYVLHSALIVYG